MVLLGLSVLLSGAALALFIQRDVGGTEALPLPQAPAGAGHAA